VQKISEGIGKTLKDIEETKEKKDKKEIEEEEKYIYNWKKYIGDHTNKGSGKDLKSELLGGIRFPKGMV
jgi:hypothetical protein